MVPCQVVQVLHPTKKFERSSFLEVDGTGLKSTTSWYLQWHGLRIEFHKHLLLGPKVTGEKGRPDRRKDMEW
jgi:hypothetical protein